jgi:hypothetical protein
VLAGVSVVPQHGGTMRGIVIAALLLGCGAKVTDDVTEDVANTPDAVVVEDSAVADTRVDVVSEPLLHADCDASISARISASTEADIRSVVVGTWVVCTPSDAWPKSHAGVRLNADGSGARLEARGDGFVVLPGNVKWSARDGHFQVVIGTEIILYIGHLAYSPDRKNLYLTDGASPVHLAAAR